MDLLLVRHGEAVAVLEALAGAADPPLSEQGKAQAARLADWYAGDGITVLLASPLRRARETADALAASTGLTVIEDDGLAEYDRDAGTYVPMHLVSRDDPEYRAVVEQGTYLAGPLGEAPEVFRERALATMEGIVAAHPGERVAVVCHGGVINAYAGHILGIPRLLWFLPENTSVSRVAAARSGVRTVLALNETGHLVGRRD